MSLNMRFVLGDAETMSVNENAVILDFSLLCVDFNKRLNYTAEELVAQGKKWKFDVMSQKERGRHIDPDTLSWWSKQDPEVRQRCVLPSTDDIDLMTFPEEAKSFVKSQGFVNNAAADKNFWFASRGELEAKLLHGIYQEIGSSVQRSGFYDYFRWRDVRTMIHFLSGVERSYVDVKDESKGLKKHDSLDDCIIDALMIQKCLRGFGDE
jgi:hypothetical protein